VCVHGRSEGRRRRRRRAKGKKKKEVYLLLPKWVDGSREGRCDFNELRFEILIFEISF
jgi:hypothetical protein